MEPGFHRKLGISTNEYTIGIYRCCCMGSTIFAKLHVIVMRDLFVLLKAIQQGLWDAVGGC